MCKIHPLLLILISEKLLQQKAPAIPELYVLLLITMIIDFLHNPDSESD